MCTLSTPVRKIPIIVALKHVYKLFIQDILGLPGSLLPSNFSCRISCNKQCRWLFLIICPKYSSLLVFIKGSNSLSFPIISRIVRFGPWDSQNTWIQLQTHLKILAQEVSVKVQDSTPEKHLNSHILVGSDWSRHLNSLDIFRNETMVILHLISKEWSVIYRELTSIVIGFWHNHIFGFLKFRESPYLSLISATRTTILRRTSRLLANTTVSSVYGMLLKYSPLILTPLFVSSRDSRKICSEYT